jgi:hypothetical protein
VHDRLFVAVFEKMKILFLKTEDEAVQRVGDGRRNEHQGGFGIEAGGLFIIPAA